MARSHIPSLVLVCILSAFAPDRAHAQSPAIDYDIVYVRQPRFGDEVNTLWPEVFHPARMDPGADLMLLHPDGTEEVLVAGGNGSITDPFVSFDGEWVYYSRFYDLRAARLNYQRADLPMDGADIFRIHVPTREIQQLTHGEFTPNTGAGNWLESNPLNPPSQYNRLGYGILNLGPCPLPGGKIAFTSNRNGFTPPKGYTAPTLQLFVMDEDGSNVMSIAPMSIGSALHPTILTDGRIMFSSYESQGLRDQRVWGIWSIYPDGRHWEPVASAFRGENAFHFMTQLSGGDIVIEDYYNLNNNGFGALYRIPTPTPGQPRFHSAFVNQNPAIQQTIGEGFLYPFRMPFTPRGMYSITPFTHAGDEAAPLGENGIRVGKFTHPSGAPDDHLLVCYSPGPCNDLDRPTTLPRYDAGLYLHASADPLWSPSELILIKNDPAYNEAWPRALVPYRFIHNIDEPAEIPWLPHDEEHAAQLPPGSPYGLVGTSSFYKRESFPGYVVSWSNTFDGLDAFNTSENGQSNNWGSQGADAGQYTNDEIWAVRLIALEPNTHRSYGPHEGQHFRNAANEKMRILGEIPLRKFDGQGNPVLDPEGNPDTSFLARIPADVPFTFQTIDRDGLVLNMAQTWHQVRPGEVRYNCGGCHAHSQTPLNFHQTAASRPGYNVFDLSKITPLLTKDAEGQPAIDVRQQSTVDVEFYRHIRPILQGHCVQCHTQSNPTPPGNLVLDDTSLYSGLPGDYARLAADENARWGHPPVIPNRQWRQTNASRYVRPFQSRRSLLIWKIFGRRLDGWTNADHPTESTPGNAGTLPPGANANAADLDFTGTIMPPPDSGIPPLTEDQKMMLARWIDLGCPINTGQQSTHGDYGWFLDDLRPCLHIDVPPPGESRGPLTQIRFGVQDYYSGLDLSTLSITADFWLDDREPGVELAGLAAPAGDGIYTITLSAPIPALRNTHLRIEIADNQGNFSRVDRRFTVLPPMSGDIDGDGDVDVDDIDIFVGVLLGFSSQPEHVLTADVNADGAPNGDDVAPMLGVVLSP